MRLRSALRTALLWGVALALAPSARAQWEPVPDIPEGYASYLAAEGDLLAVGLDGGVYVSADGGATWDARGEVHPEAVFIDALTVQDGVLYAASFPYGIFRSTDLGATWAEVNAGLGGEGHPSRGARGFARRGDYLYAGGEDAVYRLDLRDPVRWEPFSEGFLPGIAYTVQALTGRGERLVAATPLNGYVFVQEGEGPWEVVALEPPGPTPDLDVTDFLWRGDTLLGASFYGAYRSEDEGRTWDRLGRPALPGLVHALAEAGGRIYWVGSGGLSGRVYTSDDGGVAWAFEGMVPPAFDLLVHGGWMYLAHAQGVWRRAGAVGVPGGPEGEGFALASVYPNPVRGRGQVALRLGAPSEVSLRVLDVTGREVRRQGLGGLPCGEHAVSWEASGLAAGVYLLLAEGSGGERAVRRVVVAP
jgi:hypothetical protein